MNQLGTIVDLVLGNNVAAPEIYSADIVAFNLMVALLLALIIALTYKQVHKGISYSQSYVYSLVLVTMVVTLAMMVIGNDITRAFALLGTFTIIRYRTAVKDPKDTAFIFIGLVVGLAIGSSNYAIAFTGTAIISLAALILDVFNFGSITKYDHVLYMTVDLKEADQDKIKAEIDKSFKKAGVLNVTYQKEGKQVLYTYNVVMNKEQTADKALKALTKLPGIEEIEILASQNIVEF